MQCQGIIPEEVSFACSLKACSSIGVVAIAKCQNLHAEIEMNGMLKMSRNVGNAVVDMLAHLKKQKKYLMNSQLRTQLLGPCYFWDMLSLESMILYSIH